MLVEQVVDVGLQLRLLLALLFGIHWVVVFPVFHRLEGGLELLVYRLVESTDTGLLLLCLLREER